jgi:hypothetical protein
MNGDQQSKPARDWSYRGFIFGVVAGGFFGWTIMHWQRFTGHWSKYPDLEVPFWALVGGLLGLVAGIVHRLVRRG